MSKSVAVVTAQQNKSKLKSRPELLVHVCAKV